MKLTSKIGNLFLTNIQRIYVNKTKNASLEDDDLTDFFIGGKAKTKVESGVDLTKNPFKLAVVSENILCDIKSNENYKFNGVMSTKVLQLKD